MKCALCKNEAVIHLKYFDRHLCKEHFIKLTEDRIRKNITKNNLLSKNDLVAVAISGGKDSVTVLQFLKKFSKKLPIKLYGIVIDEGIKGYRDKSAKIAVENLEELGVDYSLLKFKDKIGKTMDQIAKKHLKNSCTYCGVFRRRLIENTAKEIGATKLATGHNLDDEVQSIFMNYIRGDFERMARMGPEVNSKKGFIPRIKILRYVPEKEVELYAKLSGFKFYPKGCPYVKGAFRNDVRNTLNELEELHPGVKFSILKGADNLLPLVKDSFKSAKLYKCKKCGALSPTKICKFCELLESTNF